ncbi:hypothetical protein HYALB_00000978 [Hymenoscyphus albidus]|uniref:Aminoglycoside phosphotransferase domain-containing protein n=1 Tax=Hymenoscyphus albidus TaxID=595503 RepID=A0A9N9QCN7_9HELO|nr:hypothetical protein HYALB_00000978 [Hymenoscyphus albidus]
MSDMSPAPAHAPDNGADLRATSWPHSTTDHRYYNHPVRKTSQNFASTIVWTTFPFAMSGEASPVHNSIQEINDDSWVIGNQLLLSRRSSPLSAGPYWSDGKGSFYVISNPSYPLPPLRPLTATSNIQIVHDAGGVSAVWSIGDAFCKVKILDQYATREHITLNYLREKSPLGFAIPEVHHHAEYDGRYYVFLSRLRGQTLSKTWPNMHEIMKQHYVSQVANICKELAAWQAESICGVDGQHLSDHFLTRLGFPDDCSPQNLLKNCKELGLDCSKFYFYHCDLGPGNLIVDTTTRSLGIIDWETAGFVPKEWIRTKFCVSSGMDLPGNDPILKVDWRKRLSKQLENDGFAEVADQWIDWWSKKD